MIVQRPIVRQTDMVQGRLIPIDLVNRLRNDPAWSGAVAHLEQGVLGLGIKYREDPKVQPVNEIKDELDELKDQVRDLRFKINSEKLKVDDTVAEQIRTVSTKISQIKKQRKPCRRAKDPTKSSIQVSKKFKTFLKEMKGDMTYEEFIVDKMKDSLL